MTLTSQADLIDAARDNWEVAALTGAAAAVLLVLVVLYRAMRRGRLDDAGTWVAVVTATGFSAEGMWEVAREALHLTPVLAAGVFVVAEAAMTSEAIRARRHQARHGNPGAHGAAVWAIAIAAGLIVSLNADSLVEVPIRIALPVLAAALWWLGLTSDGRTRPADAITWRLTPRRILVRWGLAEPGERDVIAIDRARRIAALTVVAHRLHHGTRLTHWWWAARLRRLALAADDEMVDDARTRVTRVHRIAALTAPNSGSDSVVRQSDTESDSRDSARDSVALRSAAVALVSDLLQQGASVSGAEIGRQFGQPPRWGQRRVSDAREAVAAASNGHKPVSVKG